MTYINRFIRTLPPLFCGAMLAWSSPLQATDNGYHPFPPGYGYLKENKLLADALKQGDRTPLRRHGWNLWAGIMQQPKGMDWPVWYSWPNATDIYQNPNATYKPCSPDNVTGSQSPKTAPSGLLGINQDNVIWDDLKLPTYPIPAEVIKAYPTATYLDSNGNCTIKDGKHFQFNGDIMIPNEAFSKQGADWITNNKLNRKATLQNLNERGFHLLEAPEQHIVTKHMYWPVKKGQMGVLPVWNNDYGPNFTKYAGYELWGETVAIDPSGKKAGSTVSTKYLYNISFDGLDPARVPDLPISRKSKVYSIKDFYHHQVNKTDWTSFDDADKAILNAASYWAYNQPFEPGDYLVTVAMHINTKEVPSWSLNSVWWTPTPGQTDYAKDKPKNLPAAGPWRHYDLVTSYDITPQPGYNMPVEMNPYIELVIHPVATNCQNCHIRAGYKSSYQSKECPDMLGHLTTDSACLLRKLLTDYQWTIPDRAY